MLAVAWQTIIALIPLVSALAPPSLKTCSRIFPDVDSSVRREKYSPRIRKQLGLSPGKQCLGCRYFVEFQSLDVPRKSFLPALRASSDTNPPENTKSEGITGNSFAKRDSKTSQKYSVARTGGRRKTDPRRDSTKVTSSRNEIFAMFSQWAIPIIVLSLILRLLGSILSGGSSNPNVVYYSRSIYQSTTYSRDGSVETRTKENFQSNIPGLVENAKTSSQKAIGDNQMGGKFYFDSTLDELIDLEDEIDSLMFRRW